MAEGSFVRKVVEEVAENRKVDVPGPFLFPGLQDLPEIGGDMDFGDTVEGMFPMWVFQSARISSSFRTVLSFFGASS